MKSLITSISRIQILDRRPSGWAVSHEKISSHFVVIPCCSLISAHTEGHGIRSRIADQGIGSGANKDIIFVKTISPIVVKEKSLVDKYRSYPGFARIHPGRISISPEIMPQASGTASQSRIAISRGDIVTLTFFADVTYEVAVDAVTYHPDDIITISGGLHDHMNRTVVLTIGSASFLITLQDVNRA